MKKALVVASFGTSVPEARGGISAVETALNAAAGDGYTMARAFTSSIIRRILAGRGETVLSLSETLELLSREGFRQVVVQPTHLLFGCEYDKLKAQADEFRGRFDKLALGRPLLADNRDLLRFAEKISETHPRREGEAVVYMGHGTEHFANAVYPALQTVLNLAGRSDIYIGTVEGWPRLADLLPHLQAPRRIRLLPLMLVAGDHARNDMAIDWKRELEQAGHTVRCEFTGLGELAWVQELYADRLRELL